MEYSCYEVNISSDSINETAWARVRVYRDVGPHFLLIHMHCYS